MSNMNKAMRDIANDLRGSAEKVRWWEKFFLGFLLTFTAYNTFRLFGQSFAALGIILAIAAIGFFDGGFLFWGHQVRKVAQDNRQRAVASVMRWICGGAAVSMTAIDMILHSGQNYIPLDANVQLYGGWTATVSEVTGATAMVILVLVLISNIVAYALFEDLDINVKQAIEERMAENAVRQRQLAAYVAETRAKNELQAQIIERMTKVGQDEIDLAADDLAKKLMPQIVQEFTEQFENDRASRNRTRVLNGSFNKPRQMPQQAQTPRPAFASEVDEIERKFEKQRQESNNNHNKQGGNNRNPPGA